MGSLQQWGLPPDARLLVREMLAPPLWAEPMQRVLDCAQIETHDDFTGFDEEGRERAFWRTPAVRVAWLAGDNWRKAVGMQVYIWLYGRGWDTRVGTLCVDDQWRPTGGAGQPCLRDWVDLDEDGEYSHSALNEFAETLAVYPGRDLVGVEVAVSDAHRATWRAFEGEPWPRRWGEPAT